MASLTDLFEDYLVSYKVPDKKPEQVKRDPYLTSDRFKQYLFSKTKKSEETPEEIISGFTNWTYNTEQPDTSDEEEQPIISQNEWIELMTNAYKKAGLNDNAIKNLIAKNALETDYGKSPVGKYNYGNITTGSSWKGDFVEGKDKDAEGNEITARFRSYKNVDDFVKDEIQLLTNLYDFNQDDDIIIFTDKLTGNNKKGYKYAVDPDYKSSVRTMYYRI